MALLKVETNKASLTSGVTQFAILGDEPGGVSIEQVPIEANFGTYLKALLYLSVRDANFLRLNDFSSSVLSTIAIRGLPALIRFDANL
jgi:hypothetical protein